MGENETNRLDDIVVSDIADRAQQKLVRRWSVVFAFIAGGLTIFGLLEVKHLVLRAEKYAQNSLENNYRDVVLNTVIEQTSSYVPNFEEITANVQSNDSSIVALKLRLDKLEGFIKEVSSSATPEVQSKMQTKVVELNQQLQEVEKLVKQDLKKKSPKGKGWIYVGEYDPEGKVWRRSYVEVKKNKPPSQLQGKTNVKISVDGLNVRDEKYVGDIIDVLNRQSIISVDRVESYFFTHYYWAYVTYN